MKVTYKTLILAILFANVLPTLQQDKVVVPPEESLGESVVAAKPPESLLNLNGTSGSTTGTMDSPKEDISGGIPSLGSMSESGSMVFEDSESSGSGSSSGPGKENVGDDDGDDSSSSINRPLLAIALIAPFVQWLL